MKRFTSPKRREPDFEAESAKIEANSISRPDKVRRSNDHHAGRIEAEGDVRITVNGQYPNTDDNPRRPPKGTVIEGERAIVEARKITVVKSESKKKQDVATASKAVHIFGRLRRVRK